jgi:hypothetical protein
MVVGPGSKHPSGVYYTVVKDLPIATITKDILDKVTAILTKLEPNKKEQNREKEKRSTNPNNYADPFKELTCLDVLGAGWNWHIESGQKMGQNPYPGHDNSPDDPHHALAIKSNDKEFFCFECQNGKLGGGGVSKLIAIRAGIMKCADPRSSPDGKDWWDTIRYALKEGLISEETAKAAGSDVSVVEIAPDIFIHKLTDKDPDGAIGLREDGSLGERKDYDRPDGKTIKGINWLSDCIVFITEETQANGKTEFTIEGVGAKDKRHIKIVLSADVVANSQSFKTALIHAFGSANKFGKMNWEFLQEITIKAGKTRVIRRIEVPCWDGNIPMIPGACPKDGVQFKLSQNVPARVYEGDLEEAKNVLRDLMNSHKFAPIVVAGTLGSPALARWRIDDRLAIGLWGLTGVLKTTFAKHCMSMFGVDYQSDRYLIKSGNGSNIALALAFAHTGILPAILDNVKSVDQRDLENYIKLVHVVVEGSDKLRGTKDAKLQESLTFLCSLIITGEVRPAEASKPIPSLGMNGNYVVRVDLINGPGNVLTRRMA